MCLSMFDIKVPACYDVIRAKPSVNVMPSSIKHTARLCNFKGTKVRQIQARIQQTDSAREKRQNKEQEGEGVGQNFKMRWAKYRGIFIN